MNMFDSLCKFCNGLIVQSKNVKSGAPNLRGRRFARIEPLEDRRLLAADPIAWSLADFNYSNYAIESSVDETEKVAVIALYGIDGTERTELARSTEFDSETVVSVSGDSDKAETLVVSGDVLLSVAEIKYDGGKGTEDSVTIQGSSDDDSFAVGSEKIDSSSNDDGGRRHGRGGRKCGREVSYAAVVEFATTVSEQLVEGATVRVSNALLTLDGLDGDDSYSIESLGGDLVLSDASGANTISFADADFSSACGRGGHWSWGWCGWHWDGWGHGKTNGVSIDLDSSELQSVSKNWNGRLQLDGSFDAFVGSSRNDVVSGSNISVTETAGSNKITLNAGDNDVKATSDRNTIIASGAGSNTLTVSGDHSKIDLSETTAESKNTISIDGERNSVKGGAGAEFVVASGSNITVDAGDGKNVVLAQNTSGRNSFKGGSGADLIVAGEGRDSVDGGNGRNILAGGEGRDCISGGADPSILIANTTDAFSVLDDVEKRDEYIDQLYKSWEEDEDLEATIALIGESCVADGKADRIQIGANEDNCVLMNEDADGDYTTTRRSRRDDRQDWRYDWRGWRW